MESQSRPQYQRVFRTPQVQPGKIYEYDMPAPGGGKITIRIRDDSEGHVYIDDPTQNRGPHFNTPDEGHYDYQKRVHKSGYRFT